MRYLHPVQAHETFVASGQYVFAKDGKRQDKSEFWSIHELGDGSQFARLDSDARAEEGKSLLAELLLSRAGDLIRLDLRYENAQFEGGIKTLSASYTLLDRVLQVGYCMNGGARRYLERQIAPGALFDLPLLLTRGRTLPALASRQGQTVAIFVPMYEHAQLFPGVSSSVASPVEGLGSERLAIGKREIMTQRYRYVDKALSYWVDEYGIVIKRISAFKRREFSVSLKNYARRV